MTCAQSWHFSDGAVALPGWLVPILALVCTSNCNSLVRPGQTPIWPTPCPIFYTHQCKQQPSKGVPKGPLPGPLPATGLACASRCCAPGWDGPTVSAVVRQENDFKRKKIIKVNMILIENVDFSFSFLRMCYPSIYCKLKSFTE